MKVEKHRRTPSHRKRRLSALGFPCPAERHLHIVGCRLGQLRDDLARPGGATHGSATALHLSSGSKHQVRGDYVGYRLGRFVLRQGCRARTCGVDIVAEHDHRSQAIQLLRDAGDPHRRNGTPHHPAGGDTPPAPIGVAMGTDAATKVAKVLRSMEEGLLAPTEMICRLS